MANNIRVFIVEDDPVQSQILYDKLMEFNDKYIITKFSSGEELINFFDNKKSNTNYYYVILDYFLQTTENTTALNGFEVIKVMGERHPKVNIILFSSYESDDKTDFKKINEEPNVLDFIKKSDHGFTSLQNAIRFHYSQNNLAQKKKRFQWAMAAFILLVFLASLHFIFSYFS